MTQTDNRQTLLISARGVTVSADGRRIVDGVDLDIRRGEIVTLIGPNGAGKTTLCRALIGIAHTDGGTITRADKLRIGYVPQRFEFDGLIPLSVARFMSLTRPVAGAEIDRLLEETRIAHLKHADISSLSGGEFQRAALARALARAPDLLVLDEPAQGVDIAGEARVYRLIEDISKQRGCAVLMVSHDLHVVMAASDRVVCLNRHVCCQGVPDAVARHPEYARLFGDAGVSALGLYAHDHDHSHDVSGRIKAHAGGPKREEGAR